MVSENSSAASIEFGSSIETLSATPIESRSSIETSSATSSTSIGYGQIFHDLLTECEFKEVKGYIPGHIPRINEKASDAYFEFMQLNPSRRMVENSLQEFCLLSSDCTIHTSSKKHDRLIYNKTELLTKLYEVNASKADESNNDSLYSAASKSLKLLYQIKNKYGSEMEWMLVMWGTWHLLKDYLHIFLKKYEHVVVRHVFSKFLTKSKVDSLINCTKWWKNHSYTIYLISAVLRENVAQFLNHLRANVSHDLLTKAEVVVDALRRDSIDQDSFKEFISNLVELRSKFDKFL